MKCLSDYIKQKDAIQSYVVGSLLLNVCSKFIQKYSNATVMSLIEPDKGLETVFQIIPTQNPEIQRPALKECKWLSFKHTQYGIVWVAVPY